jgi:hypothetical protein
MNNSGGFWQSTLGHWIIIVGVISVIGSLIGSAREKNNKRTQANIAEGIRQAQGGAGPNVTRVAEIPEYARPHPYRMSVHNAGADCAVCDLPSSHRIHREGQGK